MATYGANGSSFRESILPERQHVFACPQEQRLRGLGISPCRERRPAQSAGPKNGGLRLLLHLAFPFHCQDETRGIPRQEPGERDMSSSALDRLLLVIGLVRPPRACV